MVKTVPQTNGVWTLVRSTLAGPAAHADMLMQLLEAPDGYWKAQTAIPFRPVQRCVFDGGRTQFAEFVIDGRATPAQVETLLVTMSARMPGLSIEVRVIPAGPIMPGSPTLVGGLRLARGKLEVGVSSGIELAWQPPPHHSTLIGKK